MAMKQARVTWNAADGRGQFSEQDLSMQSTFEAVGSLRRLIPRRQADPQPALPNKSGRRATDGRGDEARLDCYPEGFCESAAWR